MKFFTKKWYEKKIKAGFPDWNRTLNCRLRVAQLKQVRFQKIENVNRSFLKVTLSKNIENTKLKFILNYLKLKFVRTSSKSQTF